MIPHTTSSSKRYKAMGKTESIYTSTEWETCKGFWIFYATLNRNKHPPKGTCHHEFWCYSQYKETLSHELSASCLAEAFLGRAVFDFVAHLATPKTGSIFPVTGLAPMILDTNRGKLQQFSEVVLSAQTPLNFASWIIPAFAFPFCGPSLRKTISCTGYTIYHLLVYTVLSIIVLSDIFNVPLYHQSHVPYLSTSSQFHRVDMAWC